MDFSLLKKAHGLDHEMSCDVHGCDNTYLLDNHLGNCQAVVVGCQVKYRETVFLRTVDQLWIFTKNNPHTH